MENKKIAILVLFFNKLGQTIECIDSFLPALQNIYVFNNGSTESSWALLMGKFKNEEKYWASKWKKQDS